MSPRGVGGEFVVFLSDGVYLCVELGSHGKIDSTEGGLLCGEAAELLLVYFLGISFAADEFALETAELLHK